MAEPGVSMVSLALQLLRIDQRFPYVLQSTILEEGGVAGCGQHRWPGHFLWEEEREQSRRARPEEGE